MTEWVLRDEIYKAAHRWPIIVLFILAGSLLGWGISILLPSAYQASAEISVELNPYRAPEDRYAAEYASTEFRNLDDYKHWQMSQLEVLVRSDAYLQETLSRLRKADPAWNAVEAPDLRNMLKAYWRNAGRWRLAAENRDPDLARQAVQIWKEVILEKTAAAIQNSQSMFATELRLRALAAEMQSVQERLALLPEIRSALGDWQAAASQFSPDRPLEPLQRWRLQALAARAAGSGRDWQTLMEEFPSFDDPLSAYQPWLDQLLAALDEESKVLAERKQALNAEQGELLAQWESAIPAGQGLSATLVVDPVSSGQPQVQHLRSSGQAALVGGLLGLLAWALLVLLQITRRAYQ